MMLLLHGLPNTTKYHDIKILVKRETSLNNFILDNLLTDNDGSKKVTIGVSDEQEGAHLMKCLNGYRVPPGNILRIIPMGKSGSQSQPMNAPQQTGYDHRGGFPRNSYQGNPEPVYNRSVPNDPVRTEARVDPWGQSSGQRSQWTPNQSAPSQSAQGYNNYQGSGNMMSSGQQAHNTPQHQRPDMRPNAEVRPYQHQQTQEQRYGYQPKNNIPDPALAQKHQRSHFLRSVEIIDEPIPRTVGHPSDGYPDRHPQQKPITIMKDNFQGPQYGLDRATQPSTQFQGHNQSPWTQAMQTQKLNPAPYDRKYPEPEKRPLISKEPDTYKGLSGPRFSPRREMLNEPRFSPRKDVPKDMGPRYSPRREIKPGPRFSPRRDSKNVPGPGSGPRFSPRRDIKDVSGPRFSPRRDIKESMPPGPRFSPRRDIKPVTGPRFSPRRDVPRFSPRRDKEGPRFSPRRDVVKEPGGPGARYSPSREIHVPHGRRPSPGPVRRMSPARRISPGPMDRRRRESPPGHRRISPGRERYSPSRHLDKGDKYPDRGGFKDVRPAYEPSQASNQAMYSGGYRPSVHDNVQYPVPGARPDQRPPTWQENKPGFAPAMTKDDGRMPKFEPRIERDIIDKRVPKFEPRDVIDKRSPIRKSRSPLRRDRSPIRDRFKKHSPSPRSPRRSWALEKRRSPEPREPPPPPMWPGQNHGRPDEYRGRNFEEEKPRMPVWERPSFDDKMDRPRRPDERAFEDARRPDLAARRPVPETRPHFSARDPNDFRRMEDDRKPFGRREESPRREERKIIVQDQLQKEIDDVYKRAVEFHKRVEERKSSERRRTEFDDRGREMERHDAKEMDYRERRDDRHDLRRYDEPRRDELRSIREEPRSVREEPRSVRDEPRGVRDEPRSIRDEPRMREPATNRPPEWRTEKDHQATLSAEVKAKREKAVEQISERIIEKHGPNFNIDLKRRVQDELKLTLSKLIREMFGEKDVSFIEIVIKFNAKYDVDDEKRIFDDVMSGFPSQYRSMKRPVDETAHHVEVPPKTAKIATDAHLNRDVSASVTADPVNLTEWTIQPASMLPMMPPTPYDLMPHMTNMPMPQLIIPPPLMVPAPTYALRDEPKFQEKSSPISAPSFTNFSDQQDLQKEGYNIYLCKDDSEPFSECQAEYLKKFLVSQLINVSSSGQGWTPDFTIKGLQTKHRYEVFTNDETTKNWIDNLDFSEFSLFNVLVYTKEELWYERAAVWLPGHSRCRNIEPLTKLKLQNKWLEGVNIGKWKFVKKVVNAKGTRLYVDMPPSSARALEKHKMMLSYELQKVNVILKAAAVDKDSFDIGLKDCTVISQAEIVTATQNSAMPTLGQDPNVVKISLKGNKTVSLVQARKIKEMIIYHIYKYQQDNGNTRTDFLKYGLCNPGYFGVLPENSESRRWLMNLQIGKLNKHAIVVIGSDSDTKYIKVEVIFRDETANNAALLTERLKQSNKGVKGLNFNKWKPVGVKEARHHVTLEIEMDLDSLETLSKMDFKLDYVNERNRQWTVDVRYDNSRSRLEEKIKRYKTEQNDSYDVDDMEIGSDFEMDDDDDIIFVGKDTVKRPSRPPSRKYDQHKKMAPPTYKPKPYPMSRTRDTSVVRKRPYPLERPTTAPMQRKMSAPLRRVPEQNAKASTPKSGAPTSKSAASTSKSAPSTSKSEASTPKSAPPASKSAPTSKSEASTSKSALSTSKSEASTSKSALSTSKSEASTPKSAEKTADKAKRKTDVAGNLMDFDDDLDIKGLREEPPSEGHYELNPLMSRVLEKELQTIMIKVWQDLPDKPANAAEKAVVDKLRTEAGDDLKNVLGLNVSKRLLNIHNPLYVKVVLSRKPDRVSLKEFVKTYNCIGLKYVPCQAHQYTFVAQFKHFSDFDKICTTKIVRCGNERVSIIPCYKFTTCPPHLKSIYSVNSQKDDANNAEDKETKVTPESKTTEPKVEETKTETSANQTTNDNVDNKEENPGVSKVEENKVESQAAKKEDNQTVKTETNATKVNEKPSVKVSPTNAATKAQTQNTKQPENASQSKAATNTVAKTQPQKTTTPATSTVAKTQPQKTTTPTKTPNKAQTANANATKVAANAVTKTQPQKPAPNSQQQNSTATAPQNTTQKPTPTNVAQKTTPQKSTNNTKPVPNKKPVAKTPQKATATKKTKEDEDLTAKISEMIAIDEVYDDDVKPEADEEVLDDEDILALMSGAIVLDECRGSDEE